MMDVRSIHDLRRFVDEVGKKLAANEKFFTGRLATRLTKAAKVFPHDQTIIQMAAFLSRRANKTGGHLINRGELKQAVNDLWTNDTQCLSLLREELGDNPNHLIGPKAAAPHHDKEGELVEDLFDKYADKRLVSEFEAAFDKNAQYRPYHPDVARQAEDICKRTLPGNPVVRTVDGRDFAILCQATYETPRGQSSVLIPVEVVKGYALVPNTFLSRTGFEPLNKTALEQHIVSTAGRYFRVDSGQLFDAIHQVKFGSTQKPRLDEVDRAVMLLKLKSAKHTPDGILYQEVDPVQNDVHIAESPEVKTFANELSTTAGSAEFVFGKNTVDTGKGIIKVMLADFGYNNAQIKVANFNDQSIIYAVALNGAGIKVPVKVSKKHNKYLISRPTTILAGGIIDEFSRAGIKSALGTNDQESAADAMGYDLKNPQALLNEVETACQIGDFKRAGDAIAALQASGDQKAFSYAFMTYMDAIELGNRTKTAAPMPRIKTIKVGGNEVEVTTGLPVDKIYVDEQGNIQAKYRKNMDKTEEGMAGGFMHAKVIMGL